MKTKDAPIQLRIILKDDVPVAQRPRRLAISEQEEVERQIEQWLKDGLIQMTLMKRDMSTSTRVARGIIFLQEYNFRVEHRKGSQMRHADALSRNHYVAMITSDFQEKQKQAHLRDVCIKKRLNVNEIISQLEEDDDFFAADIFITPPDKWQNSDEDSGDEEFPSINNLSRNQLLAEAELRITRSSQSESSIVKELVENEVQVEPTPSTSSVTQPPQPICSSMVTQAQPPLPPPPSPTPPPKRRRVEVARKWKFVDIREKAEKEYREPDFLDNLETPVQFFELFFDEEVIKLLRSETKKNAIEKGKHAFCVTTTEIKHFIAILLLSGYNSVSRYRMYWEHRVDCSFPTVAALMSRNRFEDLLQFFHAADNNNLDPNDKFAKVRPLWKLLNARWVKYYPGDKNLSIDESMIPNYGKHGTKPHIHGKPIRFGYKNCSICTRLGYLINGELYQGASTGNTHPELGVGASVVLDLISKLPQGSYSFYFDNFFTSLPLLDELQKVGHDGTGTIRANRTEKAPLKDPKEMKKTSRGSHHQCTDVLSNITLVRYNDNNIVTVASTQCGSEPKSKVKRYCDKKKKEVDQPRCFVKYNKFGFRKNISTVDAVLKLTNNIVKNINSNKKTLAVFLDLAKAFDTVPIPILLTKLYIYIYIYIYIYT
ncbi:piggyBac transposable element-derived protein 3-like [Plutella xylostella]|uniref:piggyBac transposable element-derived protein 3-like n=1 Tax=Plutella xylostella TaxID=51655 RepID=UPI002032A817|nr:piggyBac transposable element-derived protein 3-like [Plutella xylostella]